MARTLARLLSFTARLRDRPSHRADFGGPEPTLWHTGPASLHGLLAHWRGCGEPAGRPSRWPLGFKMMQNAQSTILF